MPLQFAMMMALALTATLANARDLKKTASTPMCAEVGSTTKITGSQLPTCKTLYRTGPAIRVPADTASRKYGIVFVSSLLAYPSTFTDRTSHSWQFNSSLLPKDIPLDPSRTMMYSQLIVAASLTANNITSITPVLYVQEDALIKPFIKTSFVGTLTNAAPPAGVPPTAWVRWDFGNAFSNYQLGPTTIRALNGQFANFHHAIRDGPTPRSPCRPALCANTTQCSWYSQFFGKQDAMQLYWNPAMHLAGDSELVPVFSSGVTYMTRSPRPNELLAGNVNLSKTYTFIVHGTPIGTVANFVGRFHKQLASPQTCTC